MYSSYIKVQEIFYIPFYSELNYAIPILYGTLLWFYARSLVEHPFTVKKKDALHLLPFIIFFAFMMVPVMLGKEQLANQYWGYPIVKLIVTPFYLIATFLLLKKHQAELKNAYSFIGNMHFYWLSWITAGAVILWVIACIGNIYNLISPSEGVYVLGDYFLLSLLSVFLFILGYVGINRTEVFMANREIQEATYQHYPPAEKQEQASVKTPEKTSSAKEELLYKQLLAIMEEKKPYLDPQLSLHKLSEISEISNSKLSLLINQHSNENFYEFVNQYRVKTVQEKLKAGLLKDYSLLGIATESGFNSKASFNRIFKKTTGTTPSQYAKQLEIQ